MRRNSLEGLVNGQIKAGVKLGGLVNIIITPRKINMEPTNHPFRKENDLPNLHD